MLTWEMSCEAPGMMRVRGNRDGRALGGGGVDEGQLVCCCEGEQTGLHTWAREDLRHTR